MGGREEGGERKERAKGGFGKGRRMEEGGGRRRGRSGGGEAGGGGVGGVGDDVDFFLFALFARGILVADLLPRRSSLYRPEARYCGQAPALAAVPLSNRLTAF